VHTGRETDIACGAFIPVTSREPQDALWTALQGHGLTTLQRIGDARAPGLIAHAVHDAHAAARAHLSPPVEHRRERPVLARQSSPRQ
jgi:dimethylamine/trimethylamine dehydrogenase